MTKAKQELRLWSEQGFTDQLSWVKWYCQHNSPMPDETLVELTDRAWQGMRKEYFVNQGWRLTGKGLKIMRGLYQWWGSQHADNRIMTGRLLLGMDEALQAPWGVIGQQIIVFDQSMYFEMQMCNGSAQEWLRFHLGR